MRVATEPKASESPEERALPRAVIRLLRSGTLSAEREERVRRIHGDVIETFLARNRTS